MIHTEDTIVALATPPAPGARAVVRLSGPAALVCALGPFQSSEAVQRETRRFF
jgi:tRNA U34 5-carboxymethylaminomethyl modifying GTPase MnmE/TrmE